MRIGLLVAGDCSTARDFTSGNYGRTTGFETFAAAFCDRATGTEPTLDWVGTLGEGIIGEREHTIGFDGHPR